MKWTKPQTSEEIENRVEQHRGLVKWFADKYAETFTRYAVNDFEEIENVCLYALYKAVQTFEPDKRVKFSHYFSTIAKNELQKVFNVATNARRFKRHGIKQPNQAMPFIDAGNQVVAPVDRDIELNEAGEVVGELLKRLDDEEKQIIQWRWYEEKTLEEIGKLLTNKQTGGQGIGRERVRQRIEIILEKLRNFAK